MYNSISSKESGILEFNSRLLDTAFNLKTDSTIDLLYDRLFFISVFDSNMDEFFSVRDKEFSNDILKKRYSLLIEKRDFIISEILNDLSKLYDFRSEVPEDLKERVWKVIDSQITITNFDRDNMTDDLLFYPGSIQIITYDQSSKHRRLIQLKNDVSIYEFNGTYFRFEDIIYQYLKDLYEVKDRDLWIAIFRTTFYEDENPKFEVQDGDYITTMFEHVMDKKFNKKLSKIETRSLSQISSMLPDNRIINPLISSTGYVYIKDILNFIKSKRTETQNKHLNGLLNVHLETIKRKDVLIEYPYHSFDNYLNFIKEAINDPEVKSIYLNIYRIGKSENLGKLLVEGVKKGKEINVHCEITARFDELQNISWALYFTQNGINVYLYKPKEIKIHSKCTLVEFKNGTFMSQIGTGNLNETTSKQYTDFSLLTFDQTIGKSMYRYFQLIINRENPKNFPNIFLRDFYVSQINLKETVMNLIHLEISKGIYGNIFMKCNALDDRDIIHCLNEAAQAGCRINLMIRGFCDWQPDPKLLNKNVKIQSIIWTYLEHSRVYQFGNNILMGSADMVRSKLTTRLESLVKIKSADIKTQIQNYIDHYLNSMNEHSYFMNFSKGRYYYKKER